MIRHVIEVWLLLVAAFAVGGVLGAILYVLLSISPAGEAQEDLAAFVARVIDRIRARLGLGPVWAPAAYAPLTDVYYDDDPGAYPQRHVGTVSLPDRRPPPAALLPARPEPPAAAVAAAEDHEREDVAPAESDWDDDDWIEPAIPRGERAQVENEPEHLAAPAPPIEAPAVMRPVGLSAPRNGVPDDLQKIRGIGKKNEALLNSFGVFHFGQMAAWTPAEVRWVAQHLAFPERIERDDWIGQAIALATTGGDIGRASGSRRGIDPDDFEDFADSA
ncbi:hypothetical protein [Bauldia sp.]|uniref:hypothetical protein n=1 Tax=Bauldia sp. TaxID=2575872 RepID=UPI003BAC8099